MFDECQGRRRGPASLPSQCAPAQSFCMHTKPWPGSTDLLGVEGLVLHEDVILLAVGEARQLGDIQTPSLAAAGGCVHRGGPAAATDRRVDESELGVRRGAWESFAGGGHVDGGGGERPQHQQQEGPCVAALPPSRNGPSISRLHSARSTHLVVRSRPPCCCWALTVTGSLQARAGSRGTRWAATALPVQTAAEGRVRRVAILAFMAAGSVSCKKLSWVLCSGLGGAAAQLGSAGRRAGAPCATAAGDCKRPGGAQTYVQQVEPGPGLPLLTDCSALASLTGVCRCKQERCRYQQERGRTLTDFPQMSPM